MNQQMNQQMEKTKLKTKNANKCAAAGMCGGCTYINGSYEKQLTEKEQYVRTQLKGISFSFMILTYLCTTSLK